MSLELKEINLQMPTRNSWLGGGHPAITPHLRP